MGDVPAKTTTTVKRKEDRILSHIVIIIPLTTFSLSNLFLA
jgi:hypothetical protein